MSSITSAFKNSIADMSNQFKAYNVAGKVNAKISSIGIDTSRLDPPELNKLQFKGNLKLPNGVDSYISPIAAQALSHVGIPSQLASELNLGSITMPELPDISSVTADIESLAASMNFDTDKLGIRSVSEILEQPDLSALKNVSFEDPVDIDHLPDLSHALDGLDMSFSMDELKNLGVPIGSIF